MRNSMTSIRKPAVFLLFNFYLFILAGYLSGQQDLAEEIRKKDLFYGERKSLQQMDEVQEKKLQDHLALLKEFNKNPDEFVRKIPKKERHYQFDAVVDPEVTIRVGHRGDGGKWICNPHRLGENPVIYSVGVGEDISFDTDMAGIFGAQVFMFDPNPSVVKKLPPDDQGYNCGAGKIFYQAVGLGPVSTEKGKEWDLVIGRKRCPAKSLANIASSLGHSKVDILKMDIEGGEFASLQEILSSGTLNKLGVKILLVEFHLWNDGLFTDFISLINSLTEQGYLIYRKEFNATNIKCAEYAFVHESFL